MGFGYTGIMVHIIQDLIGYFQNLMDFIHTLWVRWQYPYAVHYREDYKYNSDIENDIHNWLETHVGPYHGRIMSRAYDTYDYGPNVITVKRVRAIRFKDKHLCIQFKLTFADLICAS